MGKHDNVMEPFKIKSVEPLPQNTRTERLKILKDAGYNLFLIPAKDVIIDLLTDSGTGAMSANQWAAMMHGDESYAGARSFEHFRDTIRTITGFNYVLPIHQGRAGERVVCHVICDKDHLVLSNTMFDTTRAHVESTGAVGIDMPVEFTKNAPFNGDLDIIKLKKYLKKNPNKVSLVILTVTNNMGGGQPVSMQNIKEVSEVCREHNVKVYMDACRFAENSWFIKTQELGYSEKSPMEIAKEMFSFFDGCIMSTKKDGICNSGGFIATNDQQMYTQFSHEVILNEGFVTYGGLTGRDMEAVAVGLMEALDENYLRHRIESIRAFGDMLKQNCVSVLEPVGGHAVYLDAAEICPHIKFKEFPGWALNCVLYLEGGIRACSLGNVMNGVFPDGTERLWTKELVRLAVPRRTYTMSHFKYVVDVIGRIAAHSHLVSPMKIVKAPNVLRHFTAILSPIEDHLFEVEKTGTKTGLIKERPSYGIK
ncbi:tryptophanase-like [Liolophura sinensis]|uniref:tryptophanase-like n=1 Tax=Liolophura sinensis TaxID=3198878 RepID=UPI0031597A68